MHSKNLLNLIIKKLTGEAIAGELSQLTNIIKDNPADKFFVNTITGWFNTNNEVDGPQSERLFKRIKDKIDL
jgi:hypothetical protein